MYRVILVSIILGERLVEHVELVHVVGSPIDDNLVVRLNAPSLQ